MKAETNTKRFTYAGARLSVWRDMRGAWHWGESVRSGTPLSKGACRDMADGEKRARAWAEETMGGIVAAAQQTQGTPA